MPCPTVISFNSLHDGSLTEKDLNKIYKGELVVDFPKFSYYKAPVTTTLPTKKANLIQLYQTIVGPYYMEITEQYRKMEPGKLKAAFKTSRFDHVTFSGVFKRRKAEGLIKLSGYAVFDFDHVQELNALKNILIADSNLDVQLLFVSPSGDGLKMILFNEDQASFPDFYSCVVKYLSFKYPDYSSSLDTKTKDISRTCFLCFDPDAFIKKEYLQLWQV